MEWWITGSSRKLLGPFSTEFLLKGIGVGKVPDGALVCEVGGTSWKTIGNVAIFVPAFAQLERARLFAAGGQDDFDDSLETTIAQRSPLFASDPPPALPADGYDDGEEKTIVDRSPFRPSEPP